ncbi:MAG: hypothetical protein OXC13_07860 [Caldilineaceae bacterium]|nr:hypothetical protein [Caldilineaceae bacterium]
MARQAAVVTALDALAADLLGDRPADAVAYAERLQACPEAHPSVVGSAVALPDPSGPVIGSPCAHRTAGGYATQSQG